MLKAYPSADLFAEWKTQRFISPDPELLGSSALLVILTDVKFWAANSDQLYEWCKNHGATVSGLAVEFETPQDLTLFTLRWSQ
jgi:hypothetical protein